MRYLKAVLILFVVSLVILATVGAIDAKEARDDPQNLIGHEETWWMNPDTIDPNDLTAIMLRHIANCLNVLCTVVWTAGMPQTIDIPPVVDNSEEYMDNGRWMW